MTPDATDLDPATVRQRFEWARRQGRPNWLWPNLTVASWRAALATIEATLRSVLAGGASPTIEGSEVALGVAGYTSGTGPLLGFWIERGIVAAPLSVAALFDLHLHHNRLRMRRMTGHARQLADALHGSGIPVVVLKGMHTAHAYFPEAGTRPCTDIDLLVPEWADDAASEVLHRAGYVAGRRAPMPREQTWKRPEVADLPISLTFVHAEDPWSIDLHRSLNRGYSTGTPVIPLDDLCPPRLPHWTLAKTAMVLPQPLLLLQLATHACCGFQSLTLLRLWELASVIRSDIGNGSLRWDDFVGMADRAGGLGLVYPALRLVEALAPDTVPDPVLTACRGRVPASVRRLVDPLTPADAQRVVRCSVAERFMWARSRRELVRQIAGEILPAGSSFPELVGLYRMRAWRLVRRTVTR